MGGSVIGSTGIQGSTGMQGTTGIIGPACSDGTYWQWTFTKPTGYTMSSVVMQDGTFQAPTAVRTVPPNAVGAKPYST